MINRHFTFAVHHKSFFGLDFGTNKSSSLQFALLEKPLVRNNYELSAFRKIAQYNHWFLIVCSQFTEQCWIRT